MMIVRVLTMNNKEKNPIEPLAISQITTASLTWRRYLQRSIDSHKITLKQGFVLQELERREFLYPSQIAEMLYADRPTATVIIKNLERQGWVTREKDPHNRKYVRIKGTDAGREKVAEVEQFIATTTLFDPMACFDEEEVKELERLLGKLNKHLKTIR